VQTYTCERCGQLKNCGLIIIHHLRFVPSSLRFSHSHTHTQSVYFPRPPPFLTAPPPPAPPLICCRDQTWANWEGTRQSGMCDSMRVCVCVREYMCVYRCVWYISSMCVTWRISTWVFIQICVYVCICVCVCLCTWVCMCVHAIFGRDLLVRVKWLVCAWVYASWVYASWVCLYVTMYMRVCYV